MYSKSPGLQFQCHKQKTEYIATKAEVEREREMKKPSRKKTLRYHIPHVSNNSSAAMTNSLQLKDQPRRRQRWHSAPQDQEGQRCAGTKPIGLAKGRSSPSSHVSHAKDSVTSNGRKLWRRQLDNASGANGSPGHCLSRRKEREVRERLSGGANVSSPTAWSGWGLSGSGHCRST